MTAPTEPGALVPPGWMNGLNDCVGDSPLMFWFHPDTSRSELWCPGGFLHALGYRPGEIPSTVEAYLGCVHPEDLARVRQRIAGFQRARASESSLPEKPRPPMTAMYCSPATE